MIRVYALPPNEGWIVDRIASEFAAACASSAPTQAEADVVWAAAGWCVDRVTVDRPIVASVHHVCKAEHQRAVEQLSADPRVAAIHVPCAATEVAVRALTSKPIVKLPYWIDLTKWKRSSPSAVAALRTALGLPSGVRLVGSFQRDTEGSDLRSPKLEKGPDLFAERLAELARERPTVALLAGWRRQYVKSRLSELGVEHRSIELAPIELLRTLYCALDLYVVSSRCEGGPQALLECAALSVPIVSRDVGMARDVLAPSSISDDLRLAVPDVAYAAAHVREFDASVLIPKYASEIGRFAR